MGTAFKPCPATTAGERDRCTRRALSRRLVDRRARAPILSSSDDGDPPPRPGRGRSSAGGPQDDRRIGGPRRSTVRTPPRPAKTISVFCSGAKVRYFRFSLTFLSSRFSERPCPKPSGVGNRQRATRVRVRTAGEGHLVLSPVLAVVSRTLAALIVPIPGTKRPARVAYWR